MGMNVGGSGQKAEINVTPMIDVLLVLIIIFLVITPQVSQGLNALVPQPSDHPASSAEASHQIVITVAKDGAIEINQQPVAIASLGDRLSGMRGISDHLFIRGDREIEFQAVAHVIDIACGAGWDRIGLMTR
jgi:biopolymer transport protein TolR